MVQSIIPPFLLHECDMLSLTLRSKQMFEKRAHRKIFGTQEVRNGG